jgi:hypothetical protein
MYGVDLNFQVNAKWLQFLAPIVATSITLNAKVDTSQVCHNPNTVLIFITAATKLSPILSVHISQLPNTSTVLISTFLNVLTKILAMYFQLCSSIKTYVVLEYYDTQELGTTN